MGSPAADGVLRGCPSRRSDSRGGGGGGGGGGGVAVRPSSSSHSAVFRPPAVVVPPIPPPPPPPSVSPRSGNRVRSGGIGRAAGPPGRARAGGSGGGTSGGETRGGASPTRRGELLDSAVAEYESTIRSLRSRLDAAEEALHEQAQVGLGECAGGSPQSQISQREVEEMAIKYGRAELELASVHMQLHDAERRARDAEGERDELRAELENGATGVGDDGNDGVAEMRAALEGTAAERDALRWERDALRREVDAARDESDALRGERAARLGDNRRSLRQVMSWPEDAPRSEAELGTPMAHFRGIKDETERGAAPEDSSTASSTDYRFLAEDLEEQLEVVKGEVGKLRTALAEQRAVNEALRPWQGGVGRDSPREEIVRLRVRVGELEARGGAADEREKDREEAMRRAVDAREKAMREVHEAQRRLEGRAAELERANGELTEERDGLAAKAAEHTERIAALTTERVALVDERDSREKEAASLKEENAALAKENVALTEERYSLKEALTTLTGQKDSLAEAVAKLRDENSALISDKKAEAAARADLEERAALLSKNVASMWESNTELEASNQRLTERLGRLEGAAEAIRERDDEIASLRGRVQRLGEALQRGRAEMVAMTAASAAAGRGGSEAGGGPSGDRAQSSSEEGDAGMREARSGPGDRVGADRGGDRDGARGGYAEGCEGEKGGDEGGGADLAELSARAKELEKELSASRRDLERRKRSKKELDQSLKEALGLIRALQGRAEKAERESLELRRKLIAAQDRGHSTKALTPASSFPPMKRDNAQVLREQLKENEERYEMIKLMLEHSEQANASLLDDLRRAEQGEKERAKETKSLRKRLRIAEEELWNAKCIAASTLTKAEELMSAKHPDAAHPMVLSQDWMDDVVGHAEKFVLSPGGEVGFNGKKKQMHWGKNTSNELLSGFMEAMEIQT